MFIVTHNQFSGTLPPTFLSMPFARDLEIAHNQFSGPLPARFDSVALEVCWHIATCLMIVCLAGVEREVHDEMRNCRIYLFRC